MRYRSQARELNLNSRTRGTFAHGTPFGKGALRVEGEKEMKSVALALGVAMVLPGPLFAQNPNPQSPGAQNRTDEGGVQGSQGANNRGGTQNQPIRQQVQNNLEQAGYTDIEIMPESFLVRAKDKNGNSVMMVINPDSVTAITEIDHTNRSATTGSAAAGSNSGAGVRGLPGSKSGPTVTPSGTTLGEPNATKPDQSGVAGLPGNKSGPAQPPR
jgi:hypothetical protein